MVVEFRVLGDFEVRIGADRVDIGHARQQCVLLALALDANRVVSVDQLVERTWADRPPQRARGALYNYVSRIRRALAAGDGVTITRRSAGYLLAVDALAVDLHLFDHLTAQARADDDDDRAAGLFARALGLWRAEAFTTLDTPWLNTARDGLHNRRTAAELDRTDVELRRGRHHNILPELSARAAERPLDERLAGQLMLALYRCGRQADALNHYRRTQAGLADSLGVDPSPALRALHQRILTADSTLDVPEGRLRAPIGQQALPVPAQLPLAVAGFTGRHDELARLNRYLAQIVASVGIVLLSGTPGVGKTASAVQWAHRIAAGFPDGQLYVNLRGYDPGQAVSAADGLAGFLRALGVSGQDIPLELDERAARYRTTLSGRRVLVVLDNAGSVEQVRPLLPGTAGCLVLVTSRDSLAGLVALDGAHRLDLDPLPVRDAVALLARLIGVRVDADPLAAAELAEQCARLPLALRVVAELAATHPETSLAQLTRELGDRQRRLDLLDAGEARTAVRSVFSWSYQQLPDDAARAFRALGLHPGPDFDGHAVAALAGVTVEHADRLCVLLARVHLIHATGHGRYGIHDLLRAYALDVAVVADDEPGRRAALTRLLDYYLATAATAMDTLHPGERHKRPRVEPAGTPPPAWPQATAARAWLDAERPNLVAVCAHAAEHGWASHTIRLAQTLFRYLDIGGHHTEALAVHTDAHRAARASGDRFGEARALNNVAAVYWWQAHPRQAADHYREAAAIFRAGGHHGGEADALTNLGTVYRYLGELAQSAEHHRQSLVLYRKVGNIAGEAHALNGLGVVYGMLGEFARAAQHSQLALARYRQAGKTDGEADALSELGYARMRQGALALAAELYELALTRYRHHGYQGGEAKALNRLGHVLCRQHDLARAAECHRQALALHRRAGTRVGEAAALNGLGETLRAGGSVQEARRHHLDALTLATEIGDRYEQAKALDGIAAAHDVAGDPDEARAQWEKALRIYTVLGCVDADAVHANLRRLNARGLTTMTRSRP